jgi:ABC-type lipoprotein release transport system permease subunit
VLGVRLLPWDYGVRNLFRRPARSVLTLLALTLVVLLVFVVAGFVRGLDASLDVSGDPRVGIVHSLGASENIENSSIAGRTAGILAASLGGIQRRYGAAYASPELYLGTRVVTADDAEPSLGLVRGVTPSAALVRWRIQIIEGHWPGPGEVVVGRLVATKLGSDPKALAVGRKLQLEGQEWTVSGTFAAAGSALESELWCPLDDLQRAMKRQDLSLVAVTLGAGSDFAALDEFCKERLDLELAVTRESDYYASIRRHYTEVRWLAWTVMVLVAGAGVFVGLNTMFGAVAGRVRELGTLQVVGFLRRAIVLSLMQESVLLAAAATLAAAAIALPLVHGLAVRFTMAAFPLRIDGLALFVGCAVGLGLGLLGAIPPAVRALRLEIVEALKAI